MVGPNSPEATRLCGFFKAPLRVIYKSAMIAGVSESAYTEFVRVMGFSVDFQREIRTGDRFELLYETERTALMASVLGAAIAGLVCRIDAWDFFVMTRPMM